VGDVLEKNDRYIPGSPLRGRPTGVSTIIVITAIGRHKVVGISKAAAPRSFVSEISYNIRDSEWRKIGHMDPFADDLVWP